MNEQAVVYRVRSDDEISRIPRFLRMFVTAFRFGAIAIFALIFRVFVPDLANPSYVVMALSTTIIVAIALKAVALARKPIQLSDEHEMTVKKAVAARRVWRYGIPVLSFERLKDSGGWPQYKVVLGFSDARMNTVISSVEESESIKGAVLFAPNARYGDDNVLDLGEGAVLRIPRRGIDTYA